MKKVELLAPAGNFESLVAAVQNGADAVYFGGKYFGARAYAGNFDSEEIKKAIEYAHIRDVKAYITINTLMFDSEIKHCLEYVNFLYENDADAIIVQDIGLAGAVHEIFPDLHMHASTQMSIANAQDALFYKSMGFERLVLARENSAEEIKFIKQQVGIELENFVHGALCVSYSGKCLFSYVNGGRSANRGECAQPCRRKYEILKTNGSKDNRYFLSTKDLCTISDLEKIIHSGTDSLKIEGRMKRHEYVATVVRSYREAIDAIYEGISINKNALTDQMANVFNRKFTKGFILGEEPKNLVNSDSPNNIGTSLGQITNVNRKASKVEILLEADLSIGDGISLGEHVGRILVGNDQVKKALKGQTIMLDYIGHAKVGDLVRKTSDKEILDRAKLAQAKEFIKIPLYFNIDIAIGKNPSIEIIDDRGNVASYTDYSEIVALANKNGLNDELVKAQLSKLESTPYYLKELYANIGEGSFLKVAALNNLRRNALEMMNNMRSAMNTRQLWDGQSRIDKFLENTKLIKLDTNENKKGNIAVFCRTKEQIDVCVNYSLFEVYTDDESLYQHALNKGIRVFFATPIILKDKQIKELDKFIRENNPNILTTSMGYAKYINDYYNMVGILRDIRLDYMVNATNFLTFKFINNLDYISKVTMSLENSSLISDDLNFYPHEKIELPVLLHPILMVTEFCPYKKNVACKECQIQNTQLKLENKNITIGKDLFCRQILLDNELWNNINSISIALKHHIKNFRIDLLHEDKKETEKYIMTLMNALTHSEATINKQS